MNTRWKEITDDMLEPKLKNINSQFSVPIEKDTTWESDSKQSDVMMELDNGIGFDKYKTNICNRTISFKNLQYWDVKSFIILGKISNTLADWNIRAVLKEKNYEFEVQLQVRHRYFKSDWCLKKSQNLR